MELILWASIALEKSFPSSLLAYLTLMIDVFSIVLYREDNRLKEFTPFSFCGVPMTILSGCNRLWIATPSAKNSGIDTIVKRSSGFSLCFFKMSKMFL